MKTSDLIFGGICAIILLIPLPFGGNEEWAIFAFKALTIVLFGIHVAGPWRSALFARERLPKRPRKAAVSVSRFC